MPHPRRNGFPCFLLLWIFLLGTLHPVGSVAARPRHGCPLEPPDAKDRKRAELRTDLELPQGRPVLPVTQKQRCRLLSLFDAWLHDQGWSLEELLFVGEPNIDGLNILLEKYGREIFRAGRPYNHYAETINAISGKRPRIRRSLQQAWDLGYAWLRQEPPTPPRITIVVHPFNFIELGLGQGGWCDRPFLGQLEQDRGGFGCYLKAVDPPHGRGELDRLRPPSNS